jgi:hypothetical protein
MSDYFDTTRFDSLQSLLAHAEANHANVKKFARLGRTMVRDHFRYAELAVEDKAHRYAILRRAAELHAVYISPACDEKSYVPPAKEDVAAYNRILSVCDKTAMLKV